MHVTNEKYCVINSTVYCILSFYLSNQVYIIFFIRVSSYLYAEGPE